MKLTIVIETGKEVLTHMKGTLDDLLKLDDIALRYHGKEMIRAIEQANSIANPEPESSVIDNIKKTNTELSQPKDF